MILDATVFFDLLKLLVHRNDEKIHSLADDLFKTYGDNASTVNSNDSKYCELYITLCKEIISNQVNVEDLSKGIYILNAGSLNKKFVNIRKMKAE